MLPVPNGLPADLAALTEPMAVAWHAVRRGEVGRRQVAVVIGCGPVGLGVILMLKAHGVRTVVASDFSPGRRALAQTCGADVVVDPAEASPFSAAGIAATSRTSPPRSSSPSARARSSAACRSAGGTSGAPPRSWAPPPSAR